MATSQNKILNVTACLNKQNDVELSILLHISNTIFCCEYIDINQTDFLLFLSHILFPYNFLKNSLFYCAIPE